MRNRAIFTFLFTLFLSLSGSESLRAQVSASFSGSPVSGCSPLVVNFTDLSTGGVTGWFWDFGNGNTSTLQNPAAVYVTPGTYTVSLTVSGPGGPNTFTRTNYITVFNNPTSNFSASSPLSGCAPLSVSFLDQSTPGDGAINQWLWDFGDGNTSTSQNPVHVFANPGSYTIALVVTDVNGCQHTRVFTNYVNVSPTPVAAFTGAPLTACNPPLTVNFSNTSSGGSAPLGFSWTFGDGGSSASANPAHTYVTNGSFNVSLIVTDGNGCRDTLTRNAYIQINPINAGFSVPNPSGCAGQGISFNNTTTGPANTWLWNFGDGNTSTSQNPLHIYAAPGTYTVSLTASGPGGCSDNETRVNVVTIHPPPTANFSADTLNGCAVPFAVNFTDLSTGAVNWSWNFGDGGTSTLQNPSHVYTNPGSYTVSLTVMSADSCFTTVTIPNYIQIIEPVADFNGTPLSGCIPLTVNFTDLSTSAQAITGWQWDFGDGSTSAAQNPSHVYSTQGQFTVSLIITNAYGCTDTLIRPLYVQAGIPPVPGFSATPTVACVNDNVQFSDSSLNATEWLWLFGDGSTSTQQNPGHAYQDTGFFTVTLIVCNFGCCDTLVKPDYIYINPPVAIFTLNPAIACTAPLLVTFTDQSILPDTWNWNFGDGGSSTSQNPVHTYVSPGNYLVTLVVTDTVTGCSDDATANVSITTPSANFSGNPLSGCAPLNVQFSDLSSGASSWSWDFGDGSTSTAQNPSHTYNSAGTYTVTLIIGDANGCADTLVMNNYVSVIGPTIAITGVPIAGCVPLLVNFTDNSTSSSPITSWLWDFGDGNTSALQNPSHTYLSTGNFTVTLTVGDASGCSRTQGFSNFISVTDPNAQFIVSDSINCAGIPFSFTNQSTGSGLSYVWDFSDGNTSTANNPNHGYATNGNYTVTLSLTDVNGCQDTFVLGTALAVANAVAAFGANPVSASCPPLFVSFSDSSQFNVVAWDWDFGDGTGSVLQNPGHVYTAPGSYTVTLSILTNSGCRDTLIVPGLVNIQGPSGNFSFNPDTGCTPLPVNFTAVANNTVIYTWDFGDGNVGISGSNSISHTYTQTGVFHPILILDDGLGCTFTVVSPDSIVVDTIPFPDFSILDPFSCGPDSVHFSDLTFSTRPVTNWFWDFGDGGTSLLQNPVHYYNAPGTYTVKLTVINSLGCIDSMVHPNSVVIQNPPQALFSVPDSVGCAPFSVSFSDQSNPAAAIAAWQWSFGDGGTSAVQNPIHSYLNTGAYVAQLIVIDTVGCRDTSARNIYVNPGPVASFTASDSLGCLPLPSTFTGGGGMGIITYSWDFGDGATGTGNPFTHTYTSTGFYAVQLIVTDTLGCRDTLVIPDQVIIDPPRAGFTSAPNAGCAPLFTQFTDTSYSRYPITSWFWTFGDGNSSSLQNPVHTYTTPGTYSVTLNIQDSVGCSDTETKTNLITVYAGPAAAFIISDTTQCVPFTIDLQDQSTAGDTPITTWNWDFGDGGTSTLQNPSHGYIGAWNFTIRLIVIDSNGCRDTATTPFTSPVLPVAGFTAVDSLGCPPFPVTFNADTARFVSWNWNFGDGNTGSGTPVSHTYPNTGTYNVTLTTVDIYGCEDTLSKPDYILIDPPRAGFSSAPNAGCPPLITQFTDTSYSRYPITSWQWDFGDGQTSNLQNPSHTYGNSGTYTVSLTITDSLGCTDTEVISNLITVHAPPQAGFFISDTTQCIPFTILLQDSSHAGSAAITNHNWDFGDGATSTIQNPSHGYVSPGNYLIQLIVTDANGCRDTATQNFTSPVLPKANFTVQDSAGCAPFPVSFNADTAQIISWTWLFGDGTGGNGTPVIHTYPGTGNYTVTLMVNDIYGCSDTLIKPDYIFVDSLVADFSFGPATGCPPLPVAFTDQSFTDTTLVAWLWDFGDGQTSNQQNPTHTYTTPGNFSVTLIVTNAIGCVDTIQYPVATIYDLIPPAVPPIYMVTVLNATSDSIAWQSYTLPDFNRYVLYRETPPGSGNWMPIDSTFNAMDTTYIDNNGINTLDFSWCYKLVVVDVCGIRSDLNASHPHCTINLEASPGPDQALLNWNAYTGWNSVLQYNVYRVSSWSTATAQLIGTVPGNVTNYIDSNTVCYQDYCYRVEAIEDGGYQKVSWSDTSCTLPIHMPNQLAPEVVNATVENDAQVRLNWKPAPIPAIEFYIFRSLNGFNWTHYATVPIDTLTYLDANVDVHQQSYYYRLAFLDSCGDISPYGNHGRSILLKATVPNASPLLEWNDYSEWANGVNYYEIEVKNDLTQSWQLVTTVPGNTTEFLDQITVLEQPIYCYRVRGIELNGNQSFSLSNVACVPVGPTLFAPNAFSPNDDGLNDEFLLKGRFIKDYHIMIFSRWGELIYESNDLSVGWNGVYHEKDCQEGVYVWVVDASGYDNTHLKMRGTCTLIR